MTHPTRAGSHGRLEYLDGLRGLAALCVVLGHCAQLSQERISVRPFQGLEVFMYASSLAVPLFIVLSGFCLALPLVRDGGLPGGWRGFFRRRAWRILPVYYFALGVSLVYAVLVSQDVSRWEILGLMPNFVGPLLLIHDFYGSPASDHPLWSIAVEWHIYFLFPLLVLAWRRWGIVQATLAAAPLAWLAAALAARFDLRPHLHFYGLFALGAFAAWFCFGKDRGCDALQRLIHWPTAWAGAFVAFAAWLLMLGWSGYLATESNVECIWGLCVCILLVALALPGPFRLRAVLLSRPMQAVGACSYSLYAVHWVVVIASHAILGPRLPHLGNVAYFAVLTSMALPGSLAAAALTYILVERPSLRARRRAPAKAEPMPTLDAVPQASPGTLP